jgi:hypothetical protein
MLKRISLFFVISLHILTWGVTSEASLAATPRAHFSLAELFTPSTYKMSAGSLLKALGRFLPIDYQKGVVTSRSTNCPPAPLYKIGDFAEGGVVIWLTEDGQHGLVAAITDAGTANETFQWQKVPLSKTEVSENDSLPFSTPNTPYGQYYGGYENQTNPTITDNLDNFPAFEAAANFTVTINGKLYNDWWLPCSRELSLMYTIQDKINQIANAKGGTSLKEDVVYWSSREDKSDSNNAWGLYFFDGFQGIANKGNLYAVRCVRAF